MQDQYNRTKRSLSTRNRRRIKYGVIKDKVVQNVFDNDKKKILSYSDSENNIVTAYECEEFGLPVDELVHTIDEQEAIIKAFSDKELA